LTTKYSQKTGFTQHSVRITEQEDHAIQIFTDGSKSEHGVGAGITIFIQGKLACQLKYTLRNRCSSNQAEQLAIVKALETIEKSHINYNIPRTAAVHTDSRITLQSLKITKKSQLPHRRNQEENNSTRETQLDNHIHLD
jgi:ribonuclease HI